MNKHKTIPAKAQDELIKLGQNLRNARKLRGLTMEDVASRALSTRETVRRLENGHAGVSLGTLVHILWVLQLESSLGEVASLALDQRKQELLDKLLGSRVRKT